jgi:hypothetical protein
VAVGSPVLKEPKIYELDIIVGAVVENASGLIAGDGDGVGEGDGMGDGDKVIWAAVCVVAAFAVLTIIMPIEFKSSVGTGVGAVFWDTALQAIIKTRNIAQNNKINLFDDLFCLII